jgi:hypothetical protein
MASTSTFHALSLGVAGAIAACAAAGNGDDGDANSPPVGRIGVRPQAKPAPQNDETRDLTDPAGEIETRSSSSFAAGPTNGFFANLGTNGRTCGTCHVEDQGWTISAAGVRSRKSNDPIFMPVDGSDCPPTSPGQPANSAASTLLVGYGLIRIALGIPSSANFSLVSATNPEGCVLAPASAGAAGQLFLFRRPLPSTNLVFNTTIMWDGRETLQKIATTTNDENTEPLLVDLRDQSNSATLTHAQGASIIGTQAQSDIVSFEMSLSTAQKMIDAGRGAFLLTNQGGNGGANYIAEVLAPAFFVGINDPLGPGGFTNADFTLYRAWEPTSPDYSKLSTDQQAIGRGEALFNQTTFTIRDVPGINSLPNNPLYNPADPLAGQDVVAGCALCHNSPNIGNHSTSLPINIGVTMAQPTNNDGSPNGTLDVARLPIYTLRNPETGATVAVTDPGRALISGKWTDVGKTKGPNLRGLASRAPYFHNGSAKDLTTVVRFYEDRFSIGLTETQVGDLVAFLTAL